VLGLAVLVLGLVVVLGLYRLEVAGIVQAYAGKEAAQQLDAAVLSPIAAGMQELAPYVQQAREAAAPLVEPLQPVFAAVGKQLEQLVAYVQQQMDLVDEVARKNPDVDLAMFED
jgi:Tfp pilus assembly PilM family ATPase